MHKVLVKNVIENKYQGEVKYIIEFPQCVENDKDFCQAFMDSLDEKIQSLIIEMGLKFK